MYEVVVMWLRCLFVDQYEEARQVRESPLDYICYAVR